MAVYELATNSVKYGSMSAMTGWVDVSCEPWPDGTVIKWQEHGGPPVAEPPSRKGFGTYILNDYVASSVGGSVQLRYLDGFCWSLLVPHSHVLPNEVA
jgi:two-component sensor histidine kinase